MYTLSVCPLISLPCPYLQFTITISCVKSSVLSTVLHSPYSSQTILFTGDCFIDVFPQARARRVTLHNARSTFLLKRPISYWRSCAEQEFKLFPCSDACATFLPSSCLTQKYTFLRLHNHPGNDDLFNELQHTPMVPNYQAICLNKHCARDHAFHRPSRHRMDPSSSSTWQA